MERTGGFSTRFRRDIQDLLQESANDMSACPIKVELVDESMNNLNAIITGPPGSPYEGGQFKVTIGVPSGYPFEAPTFRFVTKIWHPNVSSVNGSFCTGLSKEWDTCMTIHSVLLNIQAILGTPEPTEHPLESAAAFQLIDDPDLFEKTAAHWTAVFAGGPRFIEEYDRITQAMGDVGIDFNSALALLSANNWHVQQATNAFLDSTY